MSENGSGGECILERVENIIVKGVEFLGNIFPGEVY